MLLLTDHLMRRVVRHARAAYPIEACGVLAGSYRSPWPTEIIEMQNREESPTRYAFDPDQQVRVWCDLENRDMRPLVVYHSHTGSRAWPSPGDVQCAVDPFLLYLIVSLEQNEPDLAVFRIAEGQAWPVELRIQQRPRFPLLDVPDSPQ